MHFTGAILLDEAMQETLDEKLQPVEHHVGRTPGNPHISVVPTIDMDLSGKRPVRMLSVNVYAVGCRRLFR